MSEQVFKGVFQLDNGFWGYRFAIVLNGKRYEQRRLRNENGDDFKTAKQAARAREKAMTAAKITAAVNPAKEIMRKTVSEVYQEYSEKGRSGKAYATIRKQDSLWNNHFEKRFGSRFVQDISLAEIQDYLEELYYLESRAFKYVESFLKMFYLIFGQAYSRGYLTNEEYNKLCVNKDTKIHMPKMKIDEETDIVCFNDSNLKILDEHFTGSNAETAYLLGRYCGLRINECYGLKWENVHEDSGTIYIDRQMQYQEGLIKLVPLKTKNAKRTIYLNAKMSEFFKNLRRQRNQQSKMLQQQRDQNQTIIQDINGQPISSLELVNCLPDGKIQTNNSMKYHSRILKDNGIAFKYHYLRHTYGTNLAILNTPIHLLCNQMGHASSKVTEKWSCNI